MALTRRFLEGMGIEEKQVESIIEAHTETVNGLKADRDKYKEQAQQVPDLQKQLEEAQAAAEEAKGLQAKADEATKAKEKAEGELADAKKSLEDFKANVQAEKDRAAKEGAYRKQVLEAAGIAQGYMDDVMAVTRLDTFELDDDGNVKDADKLVEAAKDKWKSFVVKKKTDPADVDDPPKPSGKTVEGANPRAVQIAKERHERLYGKSEE